MKEITDQVKYVIKERISRPLWGYIFATWLTFNWKNISILFMSKKDVESRITTIVSQDWFYCHYLALPIIFGVIIAAFSPYFSQWLFLAHKKAQDNQRIMEKNRTIDKLNDEIAIVDKKVEAENAEALARENEKTKKELIEARRQNRLAILYARQAKIDKNTESLDKAYNDAQEKVFEMMNKLSSLEEKLSLKQQQFSNIATKLNELSDIYFRYNNISSKEEFDSFLNEIKTKNIIGNQYLSTSFDLMTTKELTPIKNK
ncbi:TPA: hypothetical protein RFU55_002345 [Klebsiella aerogenes]|nr:hypothetical protein [Klebsiella aerogenes]